MEANVYGAGKDFVWLWLMAKQLQRLSRTPRAPPLPPAQAPGHWPDKNELSNLAPFSPLTFDRRVIQSLVRRT
jgi:hypothetical protein